VPACREAQDRLRPGFWRASESASWTRLRASCSRRARARTFLGPGRWTAPRPWPRASVRDLPAARPLAILRSYGVRESSVGVTTTRLQGPLDLLTDVDPSRCTGSPRPNVAPLPTRERRGIDFDDPSQLAKAQPGLFADGPSSARSAEGPATDEQRDLVHWDHYKSTWTAMHVDLMCEKYQAGQKISTTSCINVAYRLS
jgi:hypothetical protein